ncbi:unnamed protein product, partial [Amoebophrya sp. A25]|eukprot:GSA25T00026468001.1
MRSASGFANLLGRSRDHGENASTSAVPSSTSSVKKKSVTSDKASSVQGLRPETQNSQGLTPLDVAILHHA